MALLGIEQINGLEFDWYSVNWKKVKSQVNHLQKRIFRASSEKRWKKVRSLQHLLVRSHCAKLLASREFFSAFRFSYSYKRKKPAVIDGKLYNTPEKIEQLLYELNFTNFQPQSVRRIYIQRPDGGKRPIVIFTVKDRIMQKIVKMALEPEWEAKFEPNVFGYRKNRRAHDAIQRIQDSIQEIQEKIQTNGKSSSKSENFCWILKADITKCFEKTNHAFVLNKISVFKPLIEKWLKSGIFSRGRNSKTNVGLPQGAVISPLLLNIALDGLERLFQKEESKGIFVSSSQQTENKKGYRIIRYADDFIVIAPSREILESYVLPKIKNFLKSRGLNLHGGKTKIVRSDKGFDFLGFNIRQIRYKNHCVVNCTPSKNSIKNFLDRIKIFLYFNKHAKTSEISKRLNAIIRGWWNYFQFCQGKKIFRNIDRQLRQLLWQWCSQRHLKTIPYRCSRLNQLTDFQQLTQLEYFEKNPKCDELMKKKDTIKDMQELAKKRGLEKTGVSGKCLSKKYFNNHTRLKWQCGKCGHIWEARPNDIKNKGSWCSKCAGKKKLTIEEMQKLAKKRGLEKTGNPGKCLSKKYINNKTNLKWQCGKCGHIWEATPDSIKNYGSWCLKCAGNLKLTIEKMQKLAEKRGLEETGYPGKCLSKKYFNNHTRLKWQCGKCGYIWEAKPTNIKRKTWCPNCSKGKSERYCRGYFERIFNAKFPTNKPKWLINYKTEKKMHLDGLNKQLKLAFEYNGPQHYHFDPFYHRKYQDFIDQQERDFLKKKLCEENNVVLIIIPFIVSFDNIQDYIVKQYEKQTGLLLTDIPKYNHRYFFHRKNNLEKFLK